MAGIFPYRGKMYSISDKNKFGEFVVVKFNVDKNGKPTDIMGSKVIPGKSEKHIEQLIRKYNFENFKELPQV